eukprot:jgi/Ulvmu1/4118/UM019_0097.1
MSPLAPHVQRGLIAARSTCSEHKPRQYPPLSSVSAWATRSPHGRASAQQHHPFTPVIHGGQSLVARISRSVFARCEHNGSDGLGVVPFARLCSRDVPAVDAVVVLAGGQDEQRESQLPVWVERRLDACASLLRDQPTATKILCSGGGTPHKRPILTGSGFCTFESVSCASYLMNRGVPAQALLKETASYDTIGNGYFAATVHALPRRWQSLCVVTSEFHMPRSQAIFQIISDLIKVDFGWSIDLHFVEVSDYGIFENDVLAARKEREKQSLRRFVQDMEGITSLGAFSDWLHDTHLCYAVARQHEIGMTTGVSSKALVSY